MEQPHTLLFQPEYFLHLAREGPIRWKIDTCFILIFMSYLKANYHLRTCSAYLTDTEGQRHLSSARIMCFIPSHPGEKAGVASLQQ